MEEEEVVEVNVTVEEVLGFKADFIINFVEELVV